MAENKTLKKLKLSGQEPVLIVNAPEEDKETLVDVQAAVHTKSAGKYKFIPRSRFMEQARMLYPPMAG